jgi:hypothetical protein
LGSLGSLGALFLTNILEGFTSASVSGNAEDRRQKTEDSKNNALQIRLCAKNAGKGLFALTSERTSDEFFGVAFFRDPFL